MSVMICGISLVGTAFLEKYALARRVVAPRSSTESSAVMSVLALRCAESDHPYAIVNGIDLRGVLRSAIGRDDRTAGTVAVSDRQSVVWGKRGAGRGDRGGGRI